MMPQSLPSSAQLVVKTFKTIPSIISVVVYVIPSLLVVISTFETFPAVVVSAMNTAGSTTARAAATAAATASTSVAVLGSGISGSTAARMLAEYGVKVTLFEAGHGIGGRTSTRIVNSPLGGQSRGRDYDPNKPTLQFDHGAQYIGRPKTEAFRIALDGWIQNGWVQQWNGRFGIVETRRKDHMVQAEDPPTEAEDPPTEKYVGYPGMNSICQGLLEHENIQVVLHTRADARLLREKEDSGGRSGDESSSSTKWHLSSRNKPLGSFDWLVSSDRLSIGEHRTDLPKNILKEFQTKTRSIQNVKCVVAMVVFESPLVDIPYDGVRFLGSGDSYDEFGSLGWIARDTSKPGRQRTTNDGYECWVLQSHPESADRILNSINDGNASSLEKQKVTMDDIRQRIKDELMADFFKAIPKLSVASLDSSDKSSSVSNGGAAIVPTVIDCIGHRWGAAFPLVSGDESESTTSSTSGDTSMIDLTTNFVSCGDFYGKLTGRIEGAYLSGMSAASRLIEQLEKSPENSRS